MPPELSDDEIYDRLYAAQQALGLDAGETVRGNTAIEAARTMLRLMCLGLVKAMEDHADHVEGLTGSSSSLPEPPD